MSPPRGDLVRECIGDGSGMQKVYQGFRSNVMPDEQVPNTLRLSGPEMG